MDQFSIKPSQIIPYFDHSGNLFETLRRSSRRREMNIFFFLFRKIKNFILFRISFFCPLNSLRVLFHRWRGVKIGKNVYIGMQCVLDNAYPEYIYIEDNVSVANETLILTHSNPYLHFKNVTEARVSPVYIKNGAWVGVRSIILPGITIGRNSIISAGTLVNSNIPDNSIASGNPSKLIAKNIDQY